MAAELRLCPRPNWSEMERTVLLASILVILTIAALLFLAFLGYLPSTLSDQLAAHDASTHTLVQLNRLSCAYTAKLAHEDGTICFKEPLILGRQYTAPPSP